MGRKASAKPSTGLQARVHLNKRKMIRKMMLPTTNTGNAMPIVDSNGWLTGCKRSL